MFFQLDGRERRRRKGLRLLFENEAVAEIDINYYLNRPSLDFVGPRSEEILQLQGLVSLDDDFIENAVTKKGRGRDHCRLKIDMSLL
jgi:hypothetical protein